MKAHPAVPAAVAAVFVLAATDATMAPIASADPATGAAAVHVELNRLEERDSGCRVHLVVENGSPRVFSSYRLDLVIFAADGIIARRVALETAPLRARKTMVKEFDIEGLACAGFGRILLNDVSACASGESEHLDCVSATRTSSRAAIPFVK